MVDEGLRGLDLLVILRRVVRQRCRRHGRLGAILALTGRGGLARPTLMREDSDSAGFETQFEKRIPGPRMPMKRPEIKTLRINQKALTVGKLVISITQPIDQRIRHLQLTEPFIAQTI